jgi:MoxR-like ATPase
MFEINVDYPTLQQEIDIVKSTTVDVDADLKPVLSVEDILKFQHLVRLLPVPDALYEYVVRLVASTRPTGSGVASGINSGVPDVTSKYLMWGAGPRASQYLIIGAKTHAALHGKYSPDKEDVRAVALQVLRHRIVRNYKAEAEGVTADEIIKGLL